MNKVMGLEDAGTFVEEREGVRCPKKVNATGVL